MAKKEPEQWSRFAPWWRRPPTTAAMYSESKRREAAERQDAEREGLEPVDPEALRAFIQRAKDFDRRLLHGE
jgi:galactose-1-phosphate uridylyltransferase